MPETTQVRYPKERAKLLNLIVEDQADRASPAFFSTELKDKRAMSVREHQRARTAIAILDKIKTPSVRNIGLDGSRAMWLIALHNPEYKNFGMLVLTKMRRLFYRNKLQVFYPGIPYLADRLAIANQQFSHTARQWYGTQGWYVQYEDGTHESNLFPITNVARLAARRKRYLLITGGEKCRHTL